MGELVGRRLGNEVRDLLAGPLVGGIHAGRADDLSAEAVFPALLEAWRKGGSLMRDLRPPNGTPAATSATRSETPPALTGGGRGGASGGTSGAASVGPSGASGRPDSVFLTPLAGMASLPETLCAALRSKGVELMTSAPVERIDRIELGAVDAWSLATPSTELAADALVVAVPARQAAALLAGVDTDLAALLGDVTTASVVVVTLQLDAGALRIPLSGTGFLVPAVGGGLVTACTFLSTKWPHLAREDDVLIRASAGRAGDDRAISTADEELVESVRDELEEMIGPIGEPRQVLVTRFADAFPQYQVGHVSRVSAIEAAADRLPGFALAGATYHGVGVPACVGSGRRAARRVLAALSVPGLQR